jgi:hypothetical protein
MFSFYIHWNTFYLSSIVPHLFSLICAQSFCSIYIILQYFLHHLAWLILFTIHILWRHVFSSNVYYELLHCRFHWIIARNERIVFILYFTHILFSSYTLPHTSFYLYFDLHIILMTHISHLILYVRIYYITYSLLPHLLVASHNADYQ